MKYYLGLYALYLKLAIKVLLQYRLELWTSFVTMAVSQGMTILFISIIFTKIRVIEGWGFYEVILIYGLVTTCRNLSDLFFNVPWSVPYYIVMGELDRVLVRPANPLFQMTGEEGLQFHSIGNTAVGVAAIAVGLGGLDVQFQLWWALYIPMVVVSGVLMWFGIKLMAACVAFWMSGFGTIMYPLTWFADFAQFPAVIYPLPILIALTWVLPYAMMGFYPAAYMVRGDEYRVLGLVAPLMGWVFLGASVLVWSVGIKRYESTGS